MEDVRGRRFEGAVQASEIDPASLRTFLRGKLADSFPAPPAETLKSLAVLGLIDETPDVVERLLDFYASQVVAFYDPEPRRFFVVTGGASETLESMGSGDVAERLLYSHELTHALQDQSLRLDRRFKSLRDDGDRALALQCLLEGEATVVMVRVALRDFRRRRGRRGGSRAPSLRRRAREGERPEEPAGVLRRAALLPYVEGTAYVPPGGRPGRLEGGRPSRTAPPPSTSQILHEERRPLRRPTLLPPTPAVSDRRVRVPLLRHHRESGPSGSAARRSIRRRRLRGRAGGAEIDSVLLLGGLSLVPRRLRFESPAAAGRFERAIRKPRKDRSPVPEVSRNGADVLVSVGFASIPTLPGLPAGKVAR